MAPRNRVKKRIVGDVYSWISNKQQKRHERAHVDRSTPPTMDSSGVDLSSLPERSVTTDPSVDILRTGSPMTPAKRAVVKSTGILSPSLAAGVDKSLDAGPALTRSNPTASILVKVPSADSLKYEGSRLYKDEKGDWVADLVPENIAERRLF